MPTTRRFYPRFAQPAESWHYYRFRDLPYPDGVRPKPYIDDYAAEAEWREVREEVIAQFAAERPGTRPTYWWIYEAREPRLRLGGTGTEAWLFVKYRYAEHHPRPSYRNGMPSRWLTNFDLNPPAGCIYNFRPEILPGAQAYDPQDPPVYESQGVYLERLGLLLPGETVADREPEVCFVYNF